MTVPLFLVSDELTHRDPVPRPLTTTVLPGTPARLQVSDAQGVLATLTEGAKTVTVRGQQRTFVEQKKPFTDSFDRIISTGWGVSRGGGTWSNSGGADGDYTVSDGAGVISMTADNSSRHTSLVNNVTDMDARLSWSLDVMPTGNASSLALAFAYTSSTSQYRARLSVLTTGTVQLALECQTAAGTTVLGALTTVGTGYAAGDVWHIRAQRTGTTLRCRAWQDGAVEPTSWVHEVTDTTLGAGRIGVRGLASTGSTALPFTFRVHDIQLYSGLWPDPPTVTHNTWVRVLPAPFAGTWTPALADRIRAWAADSTPDVLAYAMGYITGAPTVLDAALGGVPVMGQAGYGPLAADGTLREGADFHEYMGIAWTFVNGETAPAASAEWIRNLDCSGFVRMIYGYHMGIPMVRNSGFDGTVLPRRTRDIGPSGPGVIVAQATDTAPPLTGMQIGDVPLFDATADATAGELDHNGIYLGIDSAGRPRFINSRKTPDGPTFGDLGGASALDGTGLYATSLRLIRRF
ncbi:NlpC/P60 family protein [Streptomyces sp. NPDC088270]|uniref:NlpC/P60 family protein n=1 Tax=unclassified Streptomyces TaxID=2593676 RepID=UPI00343B2E63